MIAPPVPAHVVCRDAGAGGYQAFPDVVRTKSGALLCVFYAGYQHISHPTAALPRGARICIVRSTDSGATWGPAAIAADTPWDDRDPHICRLRDGALILNWFTYYAGGPGARPGNPNPYKEIWTARSTDDGRTWSEPALIPSTAGDHWGVSAAIRQMPDGALIMPIYRELPDPLRVWSYVIRSTDGGRTWSQPIPIDAGNDDNDEPDIVRRKDGSLLCVMRSNRGECIMWRSVSRDGGLSWSRSERIGFPGHAPCMLRTSKGVLLLAHRLPGTALHYSLDDGATWSETIPVDGVIGAYPGMAELADGRVLIVYYEEGPGSAIRSRVLRADRGGVAFAEEERTMANGAFRVETIVGPETPTGRYKHPASIAELTNGDLMMVYYGGEGEYALDTGVFAARLKRGSRRWGRPVRVAHDPFRSLGNGVIWQAPDGLVWLFYVVRYGETWSTSRIQAKVSRDGGVRWSDSFVVSDREGMMVRGRPLVTAAGETILPVYHETGGNTEVVGADSVSCFLRLDPATRQWLPLGEIRSAKGNIQPAVVELPGGRLAAWCRRGGGYDPVTDGYIVASESTDGGRSWSPGRDTAFPNPNSAVDLLRLQSGALLLIYNDSMNDRTPLTAALSLDGGATWPYRRDLAVGPRDYAYPFAVQGADGRVHLVFTMDSRSVVRHAVFDEAWVKAGRGR